LQSLRGFDVVLHTMVNPLTPIGLRSIGATPVATVIHDAVPHPGDEHRSMDLAVRDAITRSAAVITASDHVASQVEARQSHKTQRHVIALGPHLPLPDLWDPHGPVVFLGRFAKYKGLDLLARAWARSPFRDTVQLRVIGSGPEDEVASLRSVGAFVQNSWIPDREIEQSLKGARLIVLPYLEASQSGVVTLARAGRIPVLGTNVGGLADQIGEGGLSVDPTSFEAEFQRVLSDPDVLKRIHHHLSLQPSADVQWDSIAQQYVEVLRSLG
jgi:glycosyltransferase involved in cell wall biosynthesis